MQISILTMDDYTWSTTGLNLGPPSVSDIYNDLLLYIQEAKLILYADDTNVLITDMSPDTLQNKLSLVVKQLENLFLNNDLLINCSKTFDMSFHLCHSIPTYKPHILLQNNGIEYKNVVKFLGLYITGNLNCRAHICYLCNKFSKYVFVIKSVKKNFQQPYVLEHLFRIIS